MDRFSRDKRWGKVSFEEFKRTAEALYALVTSARPSVSAEILTCEDGVTYSWSTVTFDLPGMDEALKERKSYQLSGLTKEIWERSFDVQLTLKDKEDAQPFMICLSCDCYADPKRMRFYGQCLDSATRTRMFETFARPTYSHKIGDGYSKISEFNRVVGVGLARIQPNSF